MTKMATETEIEKGAEDEVNSVSKKTRQHLNTKKHSEEWRNDCGRKIKKILHHRAAFKLFPPQGRQGVASPSRSRIPWPTSTKQASPSTAVCLN